MKQCEKCIDREYKDKLICCAVAELFHAFRELWKQLPFFGKYIKTYECGSYMADNRLTGSPDTMNPMCRCSAEFLEDAVEKAKKDCKKGLRGADCD